MCSSDLKELISVDAYTGYRQMKMYVNLHSLTGTNEGVEFFFRLGRNEDAFYEHRAMIYPGAEWDESNYVTINFQDLTAATDPVGGARRQLEELAPLLDDYDTYSGQVAKAERARARREALRFYFAERTCELHEADISACDRDLGSAGSELADVDDQLSDLRAQLDRLRIEQAGLGGDQIAALEQQIADSERQRSERAERHAHHSALLDDAGLPSVAIGRATV